MNKEEIKELKHKLRSRHFEAKYYYNLLQQFYRREMGEKKWMKMKRIVASAEAIYESDLEKQIQQLQERNKKLVAKVKSLEKKRA